MSKKQNRILATDSDLFYEAVAEAEEIRAGYCKGLQAMNNNSVYIRLQDPTHCTGSVDIDKSLLPLYPDDPRWDYVIGYESCAYFVEIHPASTSNVNEVIKKATWLRQWLARHAVKLKSLAGSEILYWIPSGRCKIAPNSPYRFKLAQKGISIISSPMKLPTTR
jgi:hypothetical protein